MKWKLSPLIVLLGLLFLIPESSSYTMQSVYVSLNSGSTLGLGTYEDYYVLVNVTSGSINSTLSILQTGISSPNDGSWTFQSNASGTLLFTDPAEDYDLRASGGTISINEDTGHITVNWVANDRVALYWHVPFTPILPFGFIMGMVGLGSMFGGILWMVKKIKDHDLVDAIHEGLIIAIVGTALFIAWLWMT